MSIEYGGDLAIKEAIEVAMKSCREASDEMLAAYLEAYKQELAGLLREQAWTEMHIAAVMQEQAYRKER
jgi:hypothetical protein